MKLLLSIILFSLPISLTICQSYPDTISVDTIIRRNYQNDTVFVRIKVNINDTIQRRYTYFLNEQKASESSYLKGELHGISYHWYNSGAPESRLEYCHGKFCGEFISFFENGKIECKANFKDQDTSSIEYYYESGKLKRIEISKNDGELIGKRYSYHENGQLAFYLNFNHVVDSVIGYFDNGVAYKKGLAYRGAEPCGKWVYRNEDGSLEKKGSYRDCEDELSYNKIGKWNYYDNGRLIKVEYYDENGNLIEEHPE